VQVTITFLFAISYKNSYIYICVCVCVCVCVCERSVLHERSRLLQDHFVKRGRVYFCDVANCFNRHPGDFQSLSCTPQAIRISKASNRHSMNPVFAPNVGGCNYQDSCLMLSGSFVFTARRVYKLRLEATAFRYVG
jgi:hypothetical protein